MPIGDLICLLLLSVGLLALLVFIFRKDQHYLKRKTSETMGAQVKDELERERVAAELRKKKFAEALAKSKPPASTP